jgi:hypothetical protein
VFSRITAPDASSVSTITFVVEATPGATVADGGEKAMPATYPPIEIVAPPTVCFALPVAGTLTSTYPLEMSGPKPPTDVVEDAYVCMK